MSNGFASAENGSIEAKKKAVGDAECAETDAEMKAINAKIKAYEESLAQAKKNIGNLGGLSFDLPRPLERLLSWLALGAVGILASSLTAFVLIGIFSGRIRIFEKYSKGTIVLLSQDPIAFWVQIAIQLIIALAFCWMLKLVWKATSGFR